MKRLTQIVIKLNEEVSETCRFFKAGDLDFFCIEIPDDVFRHYAYDNIMNILEGVDISESIERYLNMVYAHNGLQRAYLQVTIESDNETKTTEFNFKPKSFKGQTVTDILEEELRDDEEVHKLFDLFPPSILLDTKRKEVKNVLESLRAEQEEQDILLIDGEEICEDMRIAILEKKYPIVNLTKQFKPGLWGINELYEATPEIRKEDE